MKQISASIIVLSGAVIFAAGCVSRSDVGEPAMFAGGVVGLLGFLVWSQAIGLREMIDSARGPRDEQPGARD